MTASCSAASLLRRWCVWHWPCLVHAQHVGANWGEAASARKPDRQRAGALGAEIQQATMKPACCCEKRMGAPRGMKTAAEFVSDDASAKALL